MPQALSQEEPDQALLKTDTQVSADSEQNSSTIETRLRRKMIVNPRQRAAAAIATEKPVQSSSPSRLTSPANLLFALVSSATAGWFYRYFQGR